MSYFNTHRKFNLVLNKKVNTYVKIDMIAHTFIGFYIVVPTGGVISFQGSRDNGINWTSINITRDSDDARVTSTSNNGNFHTHTNYDFIRFVTTTTGSANGSMRGTTSESEVPIFTDSSGQIEVIPVGSGDNVNLVGINGTAPNTGQGFVSSTGTLQVDLPHDHQLRNTLYYYPNLDEIYNYIWYSTNFNSLGRPIGTPEPTFKFNPELKYSADPVIVTNSGDNNDSTTGLQIISSSAFGHLFLYTTGTIPFNLYDPVVYFELTKKDSAEMDYFVNFGVNYYQNDLVNLTGSYSFLINFTNSGGGKNWGIEIYDDVQINQFAWNIDRVNGITSIEFNPSKFDIDFNNTIHYRFAIELNNSAGKVFFYVQNTDRSEWIRVHESVMRPVRALKSFIYCNTKTNGLLPSGIIGLSIQNMQIRYKANPALIFKNNSFNHDSLPVTINPGNNLILYALQLWDLDPAGNVGGHPGFNNIITELLVLLLDDFDPFTMRISFYSIPNIYELGSPPVSASNNIVGGLNILSNIVSALPSDAMLLYSVIFKDEYKINLNLDKLNTERIMGVDFNLDGGGERIKSGVIVLIENIDTAYDIIIKNSSINWKEY